MTFAEQVEKQLAKKIPASSFEPDELDELFRWKAGEIVAVVKASQEILRRAELEEQDYDAMGFDVLRAALEALNGA